MKKNIHKSNNHNKNELWLETQHVLWMSEEYQPGLVSVIVPTYNRSKYIIEAMTSVFQQTYRPIELLIIDDGSTDDTAEVITKWSNQYGVDDGFRLKYLPQVNSGASVARNYGLIESNGEYIQFLDSDDLLHPEKFKVQVGILANNPLVDFVYSGTGSFTDKPNWNASKVSGHPVIEDKMLLTFLQRSAWLNNSGIYTRRSCRTIGPWDERFARCQDWEYNIRFILGNPIIIQTDQVLSLLRIHNEGRISDAILTKKSLQIVFDARKRVEHWIWAVDKMDNNVEYEYSRLYLSLQESALRLKELTLAQEIVKWNSRLNFDPAFKYKKYLFYFLAFMPFSLGSLLACGLFSILHIKNSIKIYFGNINRK